MEVFQQTGTELSLAGAATNMSFVSSNVLSRPKTFFFSFSPQSRVCHDKSKQNYVCRDKSFVATKICLSRHNVCCDKHTFVTTKDVLCRAKLKLVTTKPLLRQKHVRRDKHTFVATKDMFCRDKHMFGATKRLSRQKSYLWQLPPMVENSSGSGRQANLEC